eukprot:351034-Chlamydomonas_euryale.AAC.6
MPLLLQRMQRYVFGGWWSCWTALNPNAMTCVITACLPCRYSAKARQRLVAAAPRLYSLVAVAAEQLHTVGMRAWLSARCVR